GNCVRIGAGRLKPAAVGQARPNRRGFKQLDALRGEERRAPAPALRCLDADACLGFRGRDHPLDVGLHALEARGVGMAEVDDEPHMLGDDAGQIRKAFDARRGGAPLFRGVGKAYVVDAGNEVASANKRIAPVRHRRAAGMAGLAVYVDAPRQRLLATDDDADVAALAVEDRRLLDVQLEIAVERTVAERRLAGITDARQLVFEAQAGIVPGVERLGGRQLVGEGQRAHQRRAEAGPLFVGPDDDLDGAPCLYTAIVERADRLQPAHDPQHAVVAATANLRVEMAADGDGRKAWVRARPAR